MKKNSSTMTRRKIFCYNCNKLVNIPTLLDFTEWINDDSRQVNECSFGCEPMIEFRNWIPGKAVSMAIFTAQSAILATNTFQSGVNFAAEDVFKIGSQVIAAGDKSIKN